MLPPRCLLFPHQSLQWPHLPALLDALIELTPPDDFAGPLSHLLPGLRPSRLALCLEAHTIAHVAAWADLIHARAITAHVLIPPSLLTLSRDLTGLGLGLALEPPTRRPLIELDARARQIALHALRDALHDAPLAITPPLSPGANAYGVALDDLLVEQCARFADIRHFLLPELHPPLALLSLRDRDLHTSRTHRVSPEEEAPFLHQWLTGDTLTTARAAARKVTAGLRSRLTRGRDN